MSTYVAVFALALAYVALVAAYIALRTLAKLRRATAVLSRGGHDAESRESLLEAVERQAELTDLTREDLSDLRALVASTRDEYRSTVAEAVAGAIGDAERIGAPSGEPSGALRNVALVRYDAFESMAGRLSFSLAVLDDAGDGLTISALAGLADTRVYAKAVTSGRPTEGGPELSPEEQQAVRAALTRTPRAPKRRGPLSRKAG